jgi:hypothetical protein
MTSVRAWPRLRQTTFASRPRCCAGWSSRIDTRGSKPGH